MNIHVTRSAAHVQFLRPTETRRAVGFVVKWGGPRLFSERYGYWKRTFSIGPLYFRTYARPASRVGE